MLQAVSQKPNSCLTKEEKRKKKQSRSSLQHLNAQMNMKSNLQKLSLSPPVQLEVLKLKLHMDAIETRATRGD